MDILEIFYILVNVYVEYEFDRSSQMLVLQLLSLICHIFKGKKNKVDGSR